MTCFLSVLFVLVLMFPNLASVQSIPRSSKSKHLTDQIRTNEPVIGILTLETTGKITKFGSGQYVLIEYAQMLETAGARVVPFRINQTPRQVENMFNSINGVIFPGGHAKLQHSKYGTVGKQIFELAKKANDRGSVFPIWAECLGLELIALLASGRGLAKGQYDTALFDYSYAKEITAPLVFSKEYKNSKLFGRLPPAMFQFMKTKLRGWHNHNKAILPETFMKYKPLSDMFRVLSTNKDEKGQVFISTMEGKKYPFFLLQWHPTKEPMFPSASDPDNSQEAISNTQFLINVFINQARMSDHAFVDPNAKQSALIGNYRVGKTNKVGRDAYFIPM